MSIRTFLLFLAVVVAALTPTPAHAQNPVQWQGNARSAMSQAADQSMPVMFWVTERAKIGDDDDLRDAQEDAFRDPTVVALAQKRFIPVRVARNSRVLEEAQKLGLPTSHGLYIAIVSPEGKLIDQINPGDVADAGVLATRLHAALHKYLDALYTEQLKPIITSPESSKQDVRVAVQTVWRLGIVSADKDIAALLDRKDLTPSERTRLYSMLGSIATPPCIEALLSRATDGDKPAASALERAEPGALATLLPELPKADGTPPTARQLAAYRAACRIAGDSSPRPESFWAKSTAEQQTKVIEALKTRAQPILEYWNENVGRWR